MNSLKPLFCAFVSALLLTGGCSGASKAPPLEGASIGGPFTLVNQDGKTVSDEDFAGRYRVMYFGYTFCPDVCPTDVAKLGQAMAQLDKSDPAVSAKVVPIFVTIDPERDTPAVVKQFVSNFHPRMVGLTGSPAAIKQTADEFRIFYKKLPAEKDGRYYMDHMRIAYLIGPRGEPIAPLTNDMTVPEIAAEIKRWVR
jgi:protein SCO1/2